MNDDGCDYDGNAPLPNVIRNGEQKVLENAEGGGC